MLVYIRVEDGPHAGRRIDLKPGHTASFGKTDYADYCFENDELMADRHFRIDVDHDSCLFLQLDESCESSVNGEAAQQQELSDGDLIAAGRSRFRVQLVQPFAAERIPEPEIEESEVEVEEQVDLEELCDFLELGDETKLLAVEHSDPEPFVGILRNAELYTDAIRLQAHLMEPTAAVSWVATVISELSYLELDSQQRSAIDAATQWSEDSSEENRRNCERLAEANQHTGPGGALALAAFFSGGSIAPDEFDDIEPDSRACGQAITGAILLTAAKAAPDQVISTYQLFLERAGSFNAND